MNILFLTLSKIYDINEHDLYQDLIREFTNHGHSVYLVTPCERKYNKSTTPIESHGCNILRVKVGNQSGCSFIEKGISTVLIARDYKKAIYSYFKDIVFDLILYSTPPITLVSLIEDIKRKHGAKTYLMLKDIFPQNAVDIGIMSKKGLIYKYFRAQETKLYKLSDYIGCMSPANVNYLISHNHRIEAKIEVCPNAITPCNVSDKDRKMQKRKRSKYGAPENACVFVYGGNLGKPQGIGFMIECLKAIADDRRIFVLIVGNGSEYGKIEAFINEDKPMNVKLIQHLPREEYFEVMKCADVGMVFLDHRFTIPNFPSRILPYMENKMPIACVTDNVTDVASIAEVNGFGWRCYSNDVDSFVEMMEKVLQSDINKMGDKARAFLEDNYTTDVCYNKIISKCEG